MFRVYMARGKYAARVWMGREKSVYMRYKGKNLLCMLTRGSGKKWEKNENRKKNLGVIEFSYFFPPEGKSIAIYFSMKNTSMNFVGVKWW